MQALSFCLTFADKPLGIAAGFAKDYDSKKISAIEKNPAKSAVIASIFKSIPDVLGGPIGLFKIAVGLTTDLAAYVAQQYFARYCEKFEGPVLGTMSAEYLRDGVAWRKFTQRIVGRLTVRYAKAENQGDAVRVTGEFVGRGTEFTNWDDAIPILFKKLAGMIQVFRRTVMLVLEPVGVDVADAQGQVANALGPAGFRIPIEGELIGQKLTLRILPATVDMSNLSAKIICFVGSPTILGVVKNNYELEFHTAHHMISAAVSSFSPQDSVQLDVVVDAKKKVITLEREFKGTRGKRTGRAFGQYTLSIKATNPPS